MNKVKYNSIVFGEDSLPFIGGPCVIESKDHSLLMARQIQAITEKINIPYIFKTSFDKANRTSINSYRGVDLLSAIEIFKKIKKEYSLPILTDIHTPEQAEKISDYVDILQIPAFLCRQTDLLIAAGKTGKIINVKKGQFLSPKKISNIIEKIESTGNKNILITERGSSFGLDSLVVDMKSIPLMQSFGYPVIFDGSHSIQAPGLMDSTTGGEREFIPTLVNAAIASGCDGLFVEVHDNITQALSDSSSQWPLNKLENLLKSALLFRKAYLDAR
jgi:2-dehydro-3-deoxyphosphooctonate aldolase (KDO 8-P synthase)